MATSTREDIRDYILDQYGIGRRGVHDGGSVKTPADDSEFGGPRGAERIDNGAELRFTGDVAHADNKNHLGRISQKPTASGGTITIDPPPPQDLTDGDTFDIAYLPFRFQEIHDSITYALTQKLWERRARPVTLAKTGSAFVAGDWTVSGATQTVTAPTFPWGLDEMHVENASANDYTASVPIPVEAGKSYFLEATARAIATPATNTPTLVLYDLTNSAPIELDEATTTEQEPTILWNPSVKIPDDCERVEIRLGNAEADGDSYWSNVQFRKNEALQFVLQDRIEADRIGRVFVYSDKNWHNRGESSRSYIGHTIHPLGEGLWQLQLNGSVGGRSLWYEEFVKGSALSGDTSTTGLPKAHVAAAATMHLLRGYTDDERWGPELMKALTDWAGYMTAYDEMRTIVDRGVREIVLPRV